MVAIHILYNSYFVLLRIYYEYFNRLQGKLLFHRPGYLREAWTFLIDMKLSAHIFPEFLLHVCKVFLPFSFFDLYTHSSVPIQIICESL